MIVAIVGFSRNNIHDSITVKAETHEELLEILSKELQVEREIPIEDCYLI